MTVEVNCVLIEIQNSVTNSMFVSSPGAAMEVKYQLGGGDRAVYVRKEAADEKQLNGRDLKDLVRRIVASYRNYKRKS